MKEVATAEYKKNNAETHIVCNECGKVLNTIFDWNKRMCTGEKEEG